MIKCVMVKVGNSHYGKLSPGLIVVLPVEDFKFSDRRTEEGFFKNPLDQGFSCGKFIGYSYI